MNSDKTLRPPAFATVVAALVTVLAISLSPALASRPAPSRAQANYEIRFLTDMIDHHAMAVMMGEMCLEKTPPHPQLQELCQNIVTSQTAEIELMQGWLSDWYGIEYEPEMKPADEKQMEALAELSGGEFEIAFLEMMIQHHSTAVRRATQCTRRAHHQQIRRLCHSIIEAQSEEIALMQDWLCEWYDICPTQ